MTIILFFVILALLVLVHELGHFFSAKAANIRVDEFGIGFPPRIASFTKGETRYSLNVIPFGGFVKIFGENPDEVIGEEDHPRNFLHKGKWVQAGVLVSGVAGNLLLAWLLVSVGFLTGLPAPVDGQWKRLARDPKLTVTSVIPNSPAERAHLKPGDVLTALSRGGREPSSLSPEVVRDFITSSEEPLTIALRRGGTEHRVTVTPLPNLIENRPAIGISMEMIGIVKLPPVSALREGGKLTLNLVGAVAAGLFRLLGDAISGEADFSQISGPVGLVGLVGDARTLGFSYLLSFTAFISINLAVINLIPFPALDGGRLLFVAIETIIRRRIPATITRALNTVGFIFLIALMLTVTYHDVTKLL